MATYHTQLIYPGFSGIADIGGTKVRCNSFSMNPNQETLFYQHVIGLNDTVPGSTDTKGETIGTIQSQQLIWRPSPLALTGAIAYPACYTSSTSGTAGTLFTHAKMGTEFEVEYSYYCDKKRKFHDCRINTWSISASQGDIVQVNADIYAKTEEAKDASSLYSTSEKFLTWDKVDVSVAGITGRVQAFDVQVNNNAKYVYVNNSSAAGFTANKPLEIRLGMQEVTGTITFFLKQAERFIDETTGITVITITMPGLTMTMDTIMRNDQVEGQVGPIVTSIPFVGVGKAFGT